VAGSDPEEPSADPERFIRRAYSIASSSRQHEYLELYLNLVVSGELTPRLFAMKPGDKIWLGKKITGLFTLDEVPAGANLALISTGTGIAPYMSMLRTDVDCPEDRRIAVLHGARHSWDLGYANELRAMAARCPRFAYLPIVSRPREEKEPWTGAAGHVQTLWTEGALERAWGFRPSPENTHVLLCGSPSMIEDTIRLLQDQGFRLHERGAPGQIHVEKYW
jgi:ferredoxin--NADP+ reductase